MMRGHDAIIADVTRYYNARLAQHGATPQGVDWNGAESQRHRHRQFLRLLDHAPDAAVLDLGCGYGDFLSFLRGEGHDCPFVGYDVSVAMIDAAIAAHGVGADRQWHVGADPEAVDGFAIASGIFNVKGAVTDADWIEHMNATVERLAQAGRRGFGFNVLSTSSDPARRRSDLFYANPVEWLSYCQAIYGRSIALLQDYGLYEFTILVKRDRS